MEITLLTANKIDKDKNIYTEKALKEMVKQINDGKGPIIYLIEAKTKKVVSGFDLHGAFIEDVKLKIRISKRRK